MAESKKYLSVTELNALPEGTVVRDQIDGELGKIVRCVFGDVQRNKIQWDDGSVSVILPKSGAGLRVEIPRGHQ